MFSNNCQWPKRPQMGWRLNHWKSYTCLLWLWSRIRMLSETDLRADWPLLNPCVMLLPTTMKGSRWHFTPSYISLEHLKKIKTKDAYMYQRWFQWEGAMGEHWGHMPDEIFVEELLVKGILQVVVGCDWCPARVGLDFIAISLYCRWFKWKTARTKLRIKAVGKAALTRSQPISFYHLEGLKVGKPWLDEDLPRACSWSLERAVITYRWATRRACSAPPKKESTTERREERSQKLSTVTFKTGRSPGRRRTF